MCHPFNYQSVKNLLLNGEVARGTKCKEWFGKKEEADAKHLLLYVKIAAQKHEMQRNKRK